jgi:hypothetical protein
MSAIHGLKLAAAPLLLLVLLQHPHAAATKGAALDEGTIMRRLRTAANEAGLVQQRMEAWGGWDADDPAHHCMWQDITCDATQRVVQIQWMSPVPFRIKTPPPTSISNCNATLLLPELAQLRFLTHLEMEIKLALTGMPPEWGQAGAFQSLESLVLYLPAFTAPDPLPALQPGALPRLVQLDLVLNTQEHPVQLPPSWGDPTVWPSLQVLKLNTAIVLPLPASWAHGFPALQELTLRSDAGRLDGASRLDRARHGYQASAAQHSSSPSSLPAEWARGFPALQTLRLDCLALGGTFPAAWQARGSFPQLRELVLGGNLLSGPLPADILCNLPSLTYLNVGCLRNAGCSVYVLCTYVCHCLQHSP